MALPGGAVSAALLLSACGSGGGTGSDQGDAPFEGLGPCQRALQPASQVVRVLRREDGVIEDHRNDAARLHELERPEREVDHEVVRPTVVSLQVLDAVFFESLRHLPGVHLAVVCVPDVSTAYVQILRDEAIDLATEAPERRVVGAPDAVALHQELRGDRDPRPLPARALRHGEAEASPTGYGDTELGNKVKVRLRASEVGEESRHGVRRGVQGAVLEDRPLP
jgi:hypothetical protein